jgi:hypothetical protein
MQAAQSSAQVFLGVNLKCASCHDHFAQDWKLDDAWAYASFFSDKNLEPHRCDLPTGTRPAPRYLFPGLGSVDPMANRATRLKAVALMTTRPENPRFAKVIVNRIFKQLIGQGLIDEVDDLNDRVAWQPALLEALAYDFMKHDYDLRRLMRLIVLSETYQMQTSGTAPEEQDAVEPLFVGPRLRRLTSEQMFDALATATGYWPPAAVMNVPVEGVSIRAWRHKEPTRLDTVLGRPTRDVVSSSRPANATVLQALELVNGGVLAEYLSQGADRLLQTPLAAEADTRKVADSLTRRWLGRNANAAEAELALELLGSPAQSSADRRPGWEDFLWIMVVNPEFQYLN